MSFMCICVLCSFVEYLAFRILKEHDLWSRSHASPRWYGRLDVYRYFFLFIAFHCHVQLFLAMWHVLQFILYWCCLLAWVGFGWLRSAQLSVLPPAIRRPVSCHDDCGHAGDHGSYVSYVSYVKMCGKVRIVHGISWMNHWWRNATNMFSSHGMSRVLIEIMPLDNHFSCFCLWSETPTFFCSDDSDVFWSYTVHLPDCQRVSTRSGCCIQEAMRACAEHGAIGPGTPRTEKAWNMDLQCHRDKQVGCAEQAWERTSILNRFNTFQLVFEPLWSRLHVKNGASSLLSSS